MNATWTKFRIAATTCLAITCVTWPAVAGAAPTATFLYPAGGSPGTTVSVTVAGKLDNWPVQVAMQPGDENRGVEIVASKDKTKLDVTIKPDATPGVVWFRLIDETGASALRPFVIDALPAFIETEPNDAPDTPNQLQGNMVVDGKLAKRGDVDTYSVALKQGQTLVASMLAERVLNSPMDGVIQICDAAGFVLAQNDDAYGLDPLLVYTAPRDGTFLVRVFAFPSTPDSSISFAGGDAFVYRLTVTTGPFVDHVLPLTVTRGAATDVSIYGWNLTDTLRQARVDAQTDSQTMPWQASGAAGDVNLTVVEPSVNITTEPPAPNPAATVNNTTVRKLSLPAAVSGRIGSPRETHEYLFDAKKGQKLNVSAKSRAIGYALDGAIRITDAEGKVLAENDDAAKQPDPSLVFTAPADGTYRLALRDVFGHGGFRHVYLLSIAEAKPDFSLSLKAGEIITTPGSSPGSSPGKPTEVEVTIDRDNGYDGVIEITALNLPSGVTVEPAKSEPKGASAKAVKLKLTATAGPAQGAITIVGRGGGDTAVEKRATFSLGAGDAVSHHVWLTVLKNK